MDAYCPGRNMGCIAWIFQQEKTKRWQKYNFLGFPSLSKGERWQVSRAAEPGLAHPTDGQGEVELGASEVTGSSQQWQKG